MGTSDWIAISELFLEHGADPALITNSKATIGDYVLNLAQQKLKIRHDEMKRSRSKTDRFRSLLGIKKQRGLQKVDAII
jgi:hypothetical protein